MRLKTIRSWLSAGALLSLQACASDSLRPTILPPAELTADCPSGPEETIGEALDNRWRIVQCEWEKNRLLRAWVDDAAAIRD